MQGFDEDIFLRLRDKVLFEGLGFSALRSLSTLCPGNLDAEVYCTKVAQDF